MKFRYPSVRITPAEVVQFSENQGQQPTLEDAQRWLSSQRLCIEETMGNIVRQNLDQILGEAMCNAYPDPVFDKQYRDIDEAIVTASDAFGQKINEEQCGCSYQERDMLLVVRQMLAQRDKFVACLAYSQDFGRLDEGDEERVITRRTERVHLNCEGGVVTAEVVVEDACVHGQDVFVPENRN